MASPHAQDREPALSMTRSGLATKETKVQLYIYTNHFKVNVTNVDGYFFKYNVSIFYEDGRPLNDKVIRRKVLDRVHETYKAEFNGNFFAYDGEKSLFTVGALPSNKLEFTIVLEDISSTRTTGMRSQHAHGSPNESDWKRGKHPYPSKTYKVEISYAAKIPMQAIAKTLSVQDLEKSPEALRVLDIILRQHLVKNCRGCLLVRGFHSRFCTTQGGLSLNIDVSTTSVIRTRPVVEFLIAHQNAKDPFSLDWEKAKRALTNFKVRTSPTNTEYKITGLSEKICKELMFFSKQKGKKDENGKPQMIEITVYDYFVDIRRIPLSYSGDFPCIDVGKPNRPTYIPLELCSVVSSENYTKCNSSGSLVEITRLKPRDRMTVLTNALGINNYAAEPLLRACGVSISNNFTPVKGRILAAPRLKAGCGDDIFPCNGRWNFSNKKLVEPTTINDWAVVNFSAQCEIDSLINELIKCGEEKGINIARPVNVFEESSEHRRSPPLVRVEMMCKLLFSKIEQKPQFLLCLLPERKNSPLYGHWKRKNLIEYGVVTQCIAPAKVNGRYLTNVLLKINAKLGGLNSKLSIEHSPSNPLESKIPTLILGMSVFNGSPGKSGVPSIAAVVSSRCWPLFSKYRACVRTQSPKVATIESLFQKVSDKKDDGIIRELLMDFYTSSGSKKPDQIIIFRDGVSESQFNQVLNVELNQIIEACKFWDANWSPQFVVIIAQKNHHTRFFRPESTEHVHPGTVIDNTICRGQNSDFYLCSHAGITGITRPTHYHVLLDQVGFSPDDLQEFVHSLSYVYQSSTTAISVVAPISYAHSAATQMAKFMPGISSSHGVINTAGSVPIPQLPRLHEDVCNSMFFV
ncbi:protein argonaute 4 isoform X2 [Daucus carota subsp. sativus]|uniref:protein argonaute 4 isoform X2 n=1 Tax=Daucus carota subsp. sativus TaxID=79200 RepID=UPI0007EF3E8F|nr:PREDICTED: protein argonaute 4-like [Daucus carota subsp. sativus]